MSNSTNTATKQVKEASADKKVNLVGNTDQEIQNKSDQDGVSANSSKEKVSDNLTSTADKIQQKSDTAQGFLSDKADVINEYAHHTIEKANQIGHRAADVLANSSDYVKNFRYCRNSTTMKNTIKEKPELSIAIAGVFGLLLDY